MKTPVKNPKDAGCSWTLTDAKAKLGAVVQRSLDGKPQRIVRHGHEPVVVVAESAYRPARSTRSVVELFSALRDTEIDLGTARRREGNAEIREQ